MEPTRRGYRALQRDSFRTLGAFTAACTAGTSGRFVGWNVDNGRNIFAATLTVWGGGRNTIQRLELWSGGTSSGSGPAGQWAYPPIRPWSLIGGRGRGRKRAEAHSNRNHRCDPHCCLPFFRPLIYPPTSMQRSARWRDLSCESPISATQFSMGKFKNVLAAIQSAPSVAR